MPPHERLFDHAHAHKLDDPERERWLPPAEIVARLSLRAGQAVADLGAGTGYFALPIARAVAPGGRVYAVDLQPEMLEHLRKRVGELAITLVHGSAEATTLDAACVDLVFLANVWHEIDDRAAALAEARRILRPGGRIAIVDWRPDVERLSGPPLDHRVAARDAVRDLEASRFAPAEPEHVGAYHYLVQAAVK